MPGFLLKCTERSDFGQILTFPAEIEVISPIQAGPTKKAGQLARPFVRHFTDQLVALFSTVTARRFCDQQLLSLQTATGRSLP
jgi:hypothetical protein